MYEIRGGDLRGGGVGVGSEGVQMKNSTREVNRTLRNHPFGLFLVHPKNTFFSFRVPLVLFSFGALAPPPAHLCQI